MVSACTCGMRGSSPRLMRSMAAAARLRACSALSAPWAPRVRRRGRAVGPGLHHVDLAPRRVDPHAEAGEVTVPVDDLAPVGGESVDRRLREREGAAPRHLVPCPGNCVDRRAPAAAAPFLSSVMPGLARTRSGYPGIHVPCSCCKKNPWMAGTSPAMTCWTRRRRGDPESPRAPPSSPRNRPASRPAPGVSTVLRRGPRSRRPQQGRISETDSMGCRRAGRPGTLDRGRHGSGSPLFEALARGLFRMRRASKP